jgi:hypothetical protein
MLPLAAAAIAIVTQDQTALRASASSAAPRSAVLYEGEALEVRGARAGFLQVYQYDRERGGYVLESQVRQYPLETTSAASVLENVRLLREVPGLESLAIAHAALYLKLAAPREIAPDVFDALGTVAERLARRASSRGGRSSEDTLAGQLQVARAYGVRFATVDDEGRARICYDGESWRQVLRLGGTPDALARAALGLTRLECETGSVVERRTAHERAVETLAAVPIDRLPAHVQHRVRLRRVAVWSAVAFERARTGQQTESQAAASRALSELALVPRAELAEGDRDGYTEAALRAAASRPAVELRAPTTGRLVVTVVPKAPGETCLSLSDEGRPAQPLVERCTYGQLWPSSVHVSPRGNALTVAVQPLAQWRELWVFHPVGGTWTADVVVPASATGIGYVEWAGWTPDGKTMLVARETLVDGRYSRAFELLDVETLAVTRRAQRPADLTPFYRWQSPEWRSQTLALR